MVKLMIAGWMILGGMGLFVGCDSSESTPDTYLPDGAVGEVSVKAPSLPTTFMDTSRETYAWNGRYHYVHTIENRIPVPDGYKRVAAPENSFGDWLRKLPAKPGRPDVLLYNGQPKGNQSAQHLVLDIDVGEKDLQQCADAVMRLRAEYLWAQKKYDEISFNFTSGHACKWSDWRAGKRPKISGNNVSFVKTAAPDDSYKNFRNGYLNMVYNYAGTASLEKEMKSKSLSDLSFGDVFIQGGFPGHAVIVVDVAEHEKTGKKIFLLAQSYMPAQEIHVLRNPMDSGLSPWYIADFSGALQTPEWEFYDSNLKGF